MIKNSLKTNNELKEQAKEFLNSMIKSGNISKEAGEKIFDTLNLDDGFWANIKKILQIEGNLHDKEDMEKKLKKLFAKNNLNFEEIRKKYTEHLIEKRIDVKNIKEVNKILEPYNKKRHRFNYDEVFNLIKDNLQSLENIKKITSVLSLSCFDYLYFSPEDQLIFLRNVLQNRTIDDVRLLSMFDHYEGGVLQLFLDNINNNPELLKFLHLCKDRYQIETFSDFLYYSKYNDYHFLKFSQPNTFVYEQIVKNLDRLGNEGFNTADKNIIGILMINNLDQLLSLFENIKTSKEKKIDMFFSIIARILNQERNSESFYKKIEELLSITPSTNYENNGMYTSKVVNMEGGNEIIKEKIEKIFYYYFLDENTLETLKAIWTSYRTKNWRKNVHLAKSLGIIKQTRVLDYHTLSNAKNGYHNNSMIAKFKEIPHEDFISLVEIFEKHKISQSGVKKRINLFLIYGINSKNIPKLIEIFIEDLNIKDPDIIDDAEILSYVRLEDSLGNFQFIVNNITKDVDDLIKLKEILHYVKLENLKFSYNNITKDIDDLIKLKGILQYAKLENLKFSYNNITKDIDDLIKLKEILEYSKSENLEFICNNVTKDMDDLIKLKEILKYAQPENLEFVYNNLTQDVNDLIKLKEILQYAKLENLEFVCNNITKNVDDLEKLEELLINKGELQIIKKKYPNIQLQDLIKLNEGLNTIDQNYRKVILELLNFHQKNYEQGAVLYNLFLDYTRNSKDIFEKIDNKNEVNHENWIEMIVLYSAIEYFDEQDTQNEFDKDMTAQIRELFKQEEKENKDFVYNKLDNILKKILQDGPDALDNKEIMLIEIINKKGLTHMPVMESLVKFIYQLKALSSKEKTFDSTKININQKILAFLHKNRKWSTEDLGQFYHVSTNILKTSPSIYHKILGVFELLQPSDMKLFNEQVFPLYNVVLVLHETKNKHEITDLIDVNADIKHLIKALNLTEKDREEVLQSKKEDLVEKIKQLFKEKFNIIKIPDPIENKHIESITNHSLYLANMANKNSDKETVLGFFLALKLNDKRLDFRAGEKIDPKEFMVAEKVHIIEQYLADRERLDVLKEYSDDKEFMKLLQEGEVSAMLGNTESMSDRLIYIKQDVLSLLDNDLYEEDEIKIKDYLNDFPNPGKIVSKKYQELMGKDKLSVEENKIIDQFEAYIGKKLSKENIKDIQIKINLINTIIVFTKTVIEETNLDIEIEEFINSIELNKTAEEIFNKLGRDFTFSPDKPGKMGVGEHIDFLKETIKINKRLLTEEENEAINNYIDKVDKELSDLDKIKNKIDELFVNFKNKINSSKNERIKKRVEEIEWLFQPIPTKKENEKTENIVSVLTGDLDTVIKNIRACLSCKTNGCNNDTNLSFGTNNTFFITTSSKTVEGSYADELVMLFPSSEGMIFVMDKVYGKRSPEVLVNNIITLYNKIKKTNKKEFKILVTKAALKSCSLDMKHLNSKLLQEGINNVSISTKEEVTVQVPTQPIGDGYYEFGDKTGRSSGEIKAGGILIQLN